MDTLANRITILRILLIPVYLLLAYLGHPWWAVSVYIVACLTDFVDGYIARHYNQVTDVGKFIDPLADKMLVLAAMCYFAETNQMPGWAVAVVLFREFAVSGLRLIAVEQQRVIAAAWSGKVKTAVTMVGLAAMMLFNLPAVNITVTALIVLTTVYSGVEYFMKNYDVLRDAD